MASTGPLDRGIAAKLAAALNPLLATVSGPVVQVGRPLALDYPSDTNVTIVAQLAPGAASQARTIVFIAELCQPRWQGAALTQLVDSLPRDGRVLFAEPVAGLGLGRLAQRATSRISQKRWGYTFERDIPAELRATELTVTSVDRIFVEPAPTVFTFAAGDARFYADYDG